VAREAAFKGLLTPGSADPGCNPILLNLILKYLPYFLKVVHNVSRLNSIQNRPIQAIKGGEEPSENTTHHQHPPTPSLEDVMLHSMVKALLSLVLTIGRKRDREGGRERE